MFESDVPLKPSTPKKMKFINVAINMTRAGEVKSLCPSLSTTEKR